MVNVYDFDKTIYHGNSSFHFCLYCFKKKPLLALWSPLLLTNLLLYKIGVTSNKSVLFGFLRFMKTDSIVVDFWNEHEKNICDWYMKQKDDSDVIVSASPDFLIEEIANRLGVKCIASKVSLKTGKCFSDCKGKQKVIDFKNVYTDDIVNKSYGDSKSDSFIMDLAQESYFVKNSSKSDAQFVKR